MACCTPATDRKRDLFPPRRRPSERLLKPCEVSRGPIGDGQRNEFGDIVGMNPLHRHAQLREASERRFHQQQSLPGGFHPPLPAINGRHSAGKNVDASGETRLDDGARDPPGFRCGRARHQNHQFVGHDILQTRYSFSILTYPICSHLACHATILRRRLKYSI
jgi:hypothetical protein